MKFHTGKTESFKQTRFSKIISVDLGFAKSTRKTCGIAIGRQDELTEVLENCSFGGCVQRVIQELGNAGEEATALIIEAPLSVHFDKGSPFGRAGENEGGKTRYWYCGSGASVFLGAIFFLDALAKEKSLSPSNIYLFEGFCSFSKKGKTPKNNHQHDARALLDVFRGACASNGTTGIRSSGGSVSISAFCKDLFHDAECPATIVAFK
jgi:hypothetical protein